MDFIFKDHERSEGLVKTTLVINSDGPGEDIILVLTVDEPTSVKVSVEHTLDRLAVSQLRDMLSGWLGD